MFQPDKILIEVYIIYGAMAGLSMNILGTGDKLPVQRGSFENSVGDLLSTQRFLGGLYNFSNFVTIFSLM